MKTEIENTKIGNMRKEFGTKGFGPLAVVLVVVVVVIGGAGIYYSQFIQKSGVIEEVVMEGTVVEAVNYMESVKAFLSDAVGYSAYKASDDILSASGYCNKTAGSCTESCNMEEAVPVLGCEAWWRIYESTYAPTKEKFMGYLENQTLQRFDEYANTFSFAPSYCPSPPGNITIEELEGPGGAAGTTAGATDSLYIRISSATDGKSNRLSYTGEFFTITDNATFSDEVDAAAVKIIERARELFITQDSIRSAFSSAESSMASGCKDIALGDVCGSDIDCSAQLSTNCPGADNTFKSAAQSRIENIGGTHDGVETTIQLAGCMNAGHTANYTYSEMVENDDSCGCEEWTVGCAGADAGTDADTDAVCGTFNRTCSASDKLLCDNSLQQCEDTEGCSGTINCTKRGTLYKDVHCIYDYSGSANTSIEVKSAAKYPIGTSWKELSLKFYAVSGTNSACTAATSEGGPCEQTAAGTATSTTSSTAPAASTSSSTTAPQCISGYNCPSTPTSSTTAPPQCAQNLDCCPGYENLYVRCDNGMCIAPCVGLAQDCSYCPFS